MSLLWGLKCTTVFYSILHAICFPNHFPQLHNLITEIRTRGGRMWRKMRNLFVKPLYSILPFSMWVLEGVKWHFRSKGDVVTLTTLSTSPCSWRRLMQGTKSHHAGLSCAWQNTGHPSSSCYAELFLHFLWSLPLLRLVSSHWSYLHLWESQCQTSLFSNPLFLFLMGIRDSMGAEVCWIPIFWGQPGGTYEWHVWPEQLD